MQFMMRAGRVLLLLAVFLLLTSLLSYAITFATAERYGGLGEPSRLFPLVVVQPGGSGSAAAQSQYQVLRWGNLKGRDPGNAPQFRLPQQEGRFVLPNVGGFEPFVSFRTVDEADGRQRVKVTLTDDDYVLYSTYVTDGTTITPVDFRVWGPSSAFLALIPASALTWGLGRLLTWLRRRRTALRAPE